MTGRSNRIEQSALDEKTKAKIIDLFRNRGVSRDELIERFRKSRTTINAILREADAPAAIPNDIVGAS
jgi:hypothetical protein